MRKGVKNTCNNLINIQNIINIDEPVFLFFDYDSISGTGHSYDLMFYLLYHYMTNHITAKLLVVKTTNKFYNITLSLILNYFNIEYLYINENQTYLFSHFLCVRTYQNIFFNNVKEFINLYLIQPIITKYERNNFVIFDSVIKIKMHNTSSINNNVNVFTNTPTFTSFCNKFKCFDLNTISDEEYKIFLLNKATNIIISSGSTYYININYYLKNTNTKFISVVVNENMRAEANWMFNYDNPTKIVKQRMTNNFCANIMFQVYNLWTFNGEIIIITNIDDYISKTILFTS